MTIIDTAVIMPTDNTEYTIDAPCLIRFHRTVVRGCIFRINIPEGVELSSAVAIEGEDGVLSDCVFDVNPRDGFEYTVRQVEPVVKPVVEPALRHIKNIGRSIRMLDNKI